MNATTFKWTGDLNDDCSARLSGLLLRAEKMDENHWWWAVYDMNNEKKTIDSSNEYEVIWYSGNQARRAAEQAAQMYLDNNRG